VYQINNTTISNKRIRKILIKNKKTIYLYINKQNNNIMALDVPQIQNVEIATAKLDEDVIKQIQELNQKSSILIQEFGSIYLRKQQIQEESLRMDEFLEKANDDYKMYQHQLNEIGEQIDEKYPQGRINIQDGTVQYQPGAPTRKQLAEQQAQQANQ
jgi:transposase